MNDQSLSQAADGTGPLLPYLNGLNDRQREAVETVEGPLLVLAGAGTGKTRVLTTRIGHILLTQRAWPNQILAVTFTNKAAREMRDRVAGMIGGATEGLWIGTFHAIGTRILRRHAEVVGLKSNFTILDQVCGDGLLPLPAHLIFSPHASRVAQKFTPPRRDDRSASGLTAGSHPPAASR